VIHVEKEYDYHYKVNTEEIRNTIFETIKRVWYNSQRRNLPVYVFHAPEHKSLEKVWTTEDDMKKNKRQKHPKNSFPDNRSDKENLFTIEETLANVRKEHTASTQIL